MNERIKELRDALGITLEEFGNRLGVTRTAISRLERGNRGVTDQMAISICREFGVNETWLRTGEGEMFSQTRESVLDRLSTEYDLSKEQRSVIEAFLDLDPQERDVILKYVHNVFDRSAKPAPRRADAPVADQVAADVAGSDEFKVLREKSEPPEKELCTTAG